jgi:hypothetical protein
MTEDVLTRIQFRRVSRKIFQPKSAVLAFDEKLHQGTTMSRKSVPDHQYRSGNVPQQVNEEFHQLGRLDGSRKEPKVKAPPAEAHRNRQRLPIEVILQHGRVPFRRPGTAAVWTLAQSAFIDEDDGPPFGFGVFFSSGQRTRFHFRMAFSSRSSAWPVGRWQLHPKSRRIRHTCTVVYRMPHSCSIRSATRWLVHNAVSYPSASGPRLRPSTIRFRSESLSLGFRPARPAFFNAGDPPSSFCFAHRLTDCRCTPTLRATSASETPWSSNFAAFIRRRSNESKFRFTPAGFPMPVLLHTLVSIVTILCNTQ